MKQIKFRAWYDKMYLVTEWNFKGILQCTDEKGNIIVEPLKNLEIMQFTGLCDCNGKEIYEGDILKWADSSFKELKIEYKIFVVRELRTMYPMCEHDEKYLEVIGNVYENPELLKS